MFFGFSGSLLQLLVTVFLLIVITIGLKYIAIWKYLRLLKANGALTYFDFPHGYVKCLQTGEKEGDSFFWIKKMIQTHSKARLVATHFALTPSIQLIDSDLIKEFFSHQQKYTKSPMWGIYVTVMGKGLLFSEGLVWKKHRKILSEMFRFDQIASQLSELSQLCRELIMNEVSRYQTEIDLLGLSRNIAGQLVFRLFFGRNGNEANIEGEKATLYLARFLSTLDENTFSPESLFFGPSIVFRGILKRNRRLLSESAKFKHFCLEIIKKSTEEFLAISSSSNSVNKESKCMLMKLIASNLQGSAEEKLTDEEILHEFITFFLAGMDTTAQWLTMSLYFFSTLPKKDQNVILKEASKIEGLKAEITHNSLNECPYLVGLLKETLRVATPAPVFFDRQALEDHYIGDVLIKKGSVINVSFMANQFNPNYFKQPEEFNIHRWIPGDLLFEESVSKNPFIFTPFSAGSRNCIGQHLAMIEVKILLSILLTNFEVQIPENYKLKMSLRFVYEPQMTLYANIFPKHEKSTH